MDFLNKIKENVVLAPFTSFKIGGGAKYFYSLKNKKILPLLIKWAEKKKLPVLVFGSGSNILVSDKGFPGLVILMRLNQIKIKRGLVITDSGVLLSRVLNFCLKNNLSGLEWAAGIPGTIGGAIVNNAGAFGKSIGEFLEKVEVFISPSRTRKETSFIEMDKQEMDFSYRQSVFKKPGNKYIITRIWLKGLGKMTSESEKLVADYLRKRTENQPQKPSAGCVFKNPPGYSAGFLIEKCGLKGYQIGGAEISAKHANFIINHNHQAKARDVLDLINLIKEKVKKKFNVDLVEEIQLL